jgi:hypothetical protein
VIVGKAYGQGFTDCGDLTGAGEPQPNKQLTTETRRSRREQPLVQAEVLFSVVSVRSVVKLFSVTLEELGV